MSWPAMATRFHMGSFMWGTREHSLSLASLPMSLSELYTHCQQYPALLALDYDRISFYLSISPIIPTYPLFPPHLQPQRPFHLGEDIKTVGRGTCFVRVEEQDDDHYWITC